MPLISNAFHILWWLFINLTGDNMPQVFRRLNSKTNCESALKDINERKSTINFSLSNQFYSNKVDHI